MSWSDSPRPAVCASRVVLPETMSLAITRAPWRSLDDTYFASRTLPARILHSLVPTFRPEARCSFLMSEVPRTMLAARRPHGRSAAGAIQSLACGATRVSPLQSARAPEFAMSTSAGRGGRGGIILQICKFRDRCVLVIVRGESSTTAPVLMSVWPRPADSRLADSQGVRPLFSMHGKSM